MLCLYLIDFFLEGIYKYSNNFNYMPMEEGINKTIEWFLKIKEKNENFLKESKIKEFNI